MRTAGYSLHSGSRKRAIKSITTGITSSRPIHIRTIKIHFEIRGILGETYPVEIPLVENADTTSKTTSVRENEVRWNWRTASVAIKIVITERMMTSIFLAASSSAVAFGI